MANGYEHQGSQLSSHVIRDILTKYLPDDWGWHTIREYTDWSIEFHLSHGGELRHNYSAYGAVYRVLERLVAEGVFGKHKESRTSHYEPIPRDEVQELLNAMCDVHDNLLDAPSVIEHVMNELETLKTEFENNINRLKTILEAHNM